MVTIRIKDRQNSPWTKVIIEFDNNIKQEFEFPKGLLDSLTDTQIRNLYSRNNAERIIVI